MSALSAAAFVQTITAPIVFFTSIGSPAGVRVALLEDTELPFALDSLVGEVGVDGWRWDGEGEPRDYNRNTVLDVLVYHDESEHARQRTEYEAQS